MGTELTNPIVGFKADQDKLRFSLVPPILVEGVAEVLTFGAKKYTPNGWMHVENAKERYTDALLRHLYAHLAGETHDLESNLSHLKHCATNIAFLIQFEENELSTKREN